MDTKCAERTFYEPDLTKAHQQELWDKDGGGGGGKWEGKLTKSRWEDDSLKVGECFAWLHQWRTAPTDAILEHTSCTRSCYQQGYSTAGKREHPRLETRSDDCVAKDHRACNASWQVALRLRRLSTWNATTTHWKSCSSRRSALLLW